jgi:hypothetical protein
MDAREMTLDQLSIGGVAQRGDLGPDAGLVRAGDRFRDLDQFNSIGFYDRNGKHINPSKVMEPAT